MINIDGIISKLLPGTYFVTTASGVYECRARGLFRKDDIKPIVGDQVRIDPDEFEDDKGYIVEVYARSSQLVRPAVANVDQAVLVAACDKPKPNLQLLDKMLISCEVAQIKPIIVINKIDIDEDEQQAQTLREIYQTTGYKVITTSATENLQIDALKTILKDRVTVFAGPSGVGKSSLLNAILPDIKLQIGEISKKIKRGKHTTRHTELIRLAFGGYVLDTPGFTALNVSAIDSYDLQLYFPEFYHYRGDCQFADCLHLKEPNCAVIQALNVGAIHFSRYQSYQTLLNQLDSYRRS